jgi:hypothetical protein
MKNKLSFKRLRLHNLVNETGTFTRTPEASELDELEGLYALADWLFWVATKEKNNICDKQYNRYAKYLDTVPLVGEYFRYLCAYC